MLFDIEENIKSESGIYIITNSINKKIYIGSAINFKLRFNRHLHHLLKRDHWSKSLQNHVNKYSIEVLEFSIVLICDKSELLTNEQYYLDTFKPFGKNGFNTHVKANSSIGIKRSEETKRKCSQWKRSQEMKESMRKRNIGNKYMFGKKHSEETKKKIGEKSKGRKWSDGQKINQSERQKGKKMPLNFIEFSRQKAIGNTWGKNRKITKELCEKIGRAQSDKRPILQLNLDGDLVKEWSSCYEAYKTLNIDKRKIWATLYGKQKTSCGFKWQFKP